MNERHSEHSTEKITLFTEEDARRLDARWEAIQSSFVEAPYDAMRSADELMLEMVSIINDALDRERRQLGSQWERRDGEVTTEVLRVTLQRYRELLDRLLHISV